VKNERKHPIFSSLEEKNQVSEVDDFERGHSVNVD
jgi:hypothetical protein